MSFYLLNKLMKKRSFDIQFIKIINIALIFICDIISILF